MGLNILLSVSGNRRYQDEEMSPASDHIQEDLIHHDGKQGTFNVGVGDWMSSVFRLKIFSPGQNDLFEGDIKLTSEQKQEMASPIATHNAKKDGHWGEYGLGVVPYSIKGRFTRSQRELIEKAFKEYHEKTCIRFVPRIKESTYLKILGDDNDGCWSHIGYNGNNELNLAKKCFRVGHGT